MSERDFLEALGDHKCDAGMSVENVSAVFNIKTLKRPFIAHIGTQALYGVGRGCGKKCGKEDKCSGQFAVKYKSETYCCAQKLNKEA